MDRIPEALASLRAYNQFIIWRSVPDTPKPRKVPYDPSTLRACDPHDPQNWMPADTAISFAGMLGDDYDVGFVFTAADPFWFLDIDNCLVDGQWTATATDLLAQFKGAAVEISVSGEGLHIFGSGVVPDHSSRNAAHHIEFYTEGRFVALTGRSAYGDISTQHDAAINQLVATYFPPHDHGQLDAGWSVVPTPDWNGPEDDDTLVNKALGSGSVRQAFTGGVTFADLWRGNADTLGAKWPGDNERPYDASHADASLAQHLAFWTGKDCERIERLMRRSALLRDKWDRRERPPGYLRTTILRAVSNCQDVYASRQQVVPPPPPSSSGQVFETGAQRFMATGQQAEYFAGCVYVQDLHMAWTPDYGFLKPQAFRVRYGGYLFGVDSVNEKTTDNAWLAFTESRAVGFPKVHTSCFRPEKPSGAVIDEEGWTMVNSYIPIDTEQREGDPSRFLQFMQTLLPDQRDRDILVSYMAALVQYPGVKFQWCPLLQGAEGNGKTVLIRVLSHCVGNRYTHLPNAKEMGESGSKFNAWLTNKLFIGVEEIYVNDRREVSDALKVLITNDRVEMQGKGADQVTGDNRANFLMCSNHKDALKVSFDTRRYAVFYTAQQVRADLERDGMSGAYFPELYKWLRAEGYAVMNRYLHEYKIPDEFNPAGDMHRAPITSSMPEAVALSMGNIEQEIMEAIDNDRSGFKAGWVSSLALDELLTGIRADAKVPRNRRRAMLQGLGFDWHPALGDGGRVNNMIIEERGKPKLYIKNGHVSRNLSTGAEVFRAYRKAQGYTGNEVDGEDTTKVG